MDKYSPRQGLFLFGALLFSQLASLHHLLSNCTSLPTAESSKENLIPVITTSPMSSRKMLRNKYNNMATLVALVLAISKLICNQFLAGAEFDAQFNSHQANFASGSATTAFSDNLQIRQNFDLTFVPGVLVTDATALYAKLGVTYGQIKSQLSSPTGFTPTYISLNNSQYNWGGTLTLGVKHYFSEYGAVFAEYGYHDFGTVDFANFPNFTATYSHSERVYSQAVLAGISYYFF